MSSDIDHLVTMISGCESITSGNYKSEDSIYALAVLKLHANDAGFVAGTEGFIDSIKSKAKSVKDFVMMVIKMITDAMYSLIGGRAKTKARIAKLKNALTPEVFKSKAKISAEKIVIPALIRSMANVEGVIENEYQEFHQNVLEETPDIRAMFVDNNAIEKLLEKKIKEGRANPNEETLEVDSVIDLVNKSVNKCKKILTDSLKDEEGNAKLIKNITGVLGKYNRVIHLLTKANEDLEKSFE